MAKKIASKEEEAVIFAEHVFSLAINFFSSWQKNTRENKKMLETNHDHVGKIMTYHLIIENMINKTLMHHFKYDEKKFQDIKLNFAQKQKLLPIAGKIYELTIPIIAEVNMVRNKIAHNLGYDLQTLKTPEIDHYLSNSEKGDINLIPLEQKIEKVTIFCISLFSAQGKEIQDHLTEFNKRQPSAYEKLMDTLNVEKGFEYLLNSKTKPLL